MQKNNSENTDNQNNINTPSFSNPTLSELIIAVKEIKNKHLSDIYLSKNAISESYWLTTNIYPKSFFDVLLKKQKINTIKQLFKLLPHAIKVSKAEYKLGYFSKYILRFHDWLYSNKFEQKTTFNTKKGKNTACFSEFSINFSVLYNELLKYIAENGGTIKLAKENRRKIQFPESINYKNLSKLCNERISLSSAYSVANKDELEEVLNEQFDTAKQIIIDYKDFQKLFFRYGKAIEIITEKAYDLYANNHDNKKAWYEAVYWYKKEYEWWNSFS